MNASPQRLVLWDIDLTLVDLTGLGASWYRSALATVAGVEMGKMPRFPGRTELAITSEMLRLHGIEPTETLIKRFWAELENLSRDALPTLAEHGRALPGAAVALSTVAGHGAVQSLVTGNLPEIARHKLSAFALDEHIDFEIGGYGSLSAHRPELVSHAVERAANKHGVSFAPEAVAVIGDTPHDVESALHHGMIGIGVATGRHGEDELRASGAHAVLRDLSDTPAVLAAVLGVS